MRKLLSLVLAVSITLSSFSQNLPLGGRVQSECGFMTSKEAFNRAQEKRAFINPVDESSSAIITSQQVDGSWCYQIVITCKTPGFPAPLPSPTPFIHNIKLGDYPNNIKNFTFKELQEFISTTKIVNTKPTTVCTKTLYGPTVGTEYGTCQEAENGAAGWIGTKTDIILQSVETFTVQGTDPGQVSWAVTVSYVRAGGCYK